MLAGKKWRKQKEKDLSGRGHSERLQGALKKAASSSIFRSGKKDAKGGRGLRETGALSRESPASWFLEGGWNKEEVLAGREKGGDDLKEASENNEKKKNQTEEKKDDCLPRPERARFRHRKRSPVALS